MHWKDINFIRRPKCLFRCHLNVQGALQTESKYNSKSCIVHFRETPKLWCGWNLYWVYWAFLTDHRTNTVQLSPSRHAVTDSSSQHKRLRRGLNFFIVRTENRPTIRRPYACTVNLPWKWNYGEEKKPQTQTSHMKERIELRGLSGSTEVTENKTCVPHWRWRYAGAIRGSQPPSWVLLPKSY